MGRFYAGRQRRCTHLEGNHGSLTRHADRLTPRATHAKAVAEHRLLRERIRFGRVVESQGICTRHRRCEKEQLEELHTLELSTVFFLPR
jgi:hypothetical protein